MITLTQVNESPAAKLVHSGLPALSNIELVSMVIGGIKDTDTTKRQATDLLKAVNYSFAELQRLNVEELTACGLTQVQALRLVAVCEIIRRAQRQDAEERIQISGSQDIYSYYRHLQDLNHEEFHILHLNRANRVIFTQQLSKGGIAGTVVDVRLILKKAIEKLSSSIVLVHNHPSGNIQPSESDTAITRKIKDSASVMDIQLLDHLIIIPEGEYYSMADSGFV